MAFEFVARNGIIGLANSTISGSLAVSQSVTAQSFTGSLSGSATAAISASFASTASSADNFTVRGTLTAQTIVTQTITSSIDFVTGSSRFGSNTSNTHQFTGSVTVSGSLQVNGSNAILSNQTSSMSVATASYVLNAVSASYAATSSFANSFKATTLSLGTNGINVTTGYGNYVSYIGYTTTGSVDSSDFWIRVINIDSSPQRIRLYIDFNADNTFSQDEFEIVTSGYGMTNHIFRKATTFYNTSKVIGILTSNPTAGSQEVWLNIAGIAASGTINLYSNVALEPLANMQTSKTLTKPTKAGGGTELTINNSKRTKYTIQTSAGAEFNGEVSITGSLFQTGSSLFTGPVTSTLGFTGSLFGTASYATTALTASNANTASYVLNAVSSSYALTSTTAASATIVNGTSGQLVYKDDRIIEPNSITSARAQFGFTSWNNDNAAPYADFLHLRSYTDGTGGNDNLVSFRKDTIGMRIWQQSWNSASAYSNYRDAALVSGSATGYIPLYQSATVLTGSSIFQSGLNIGIGTTIPNALLAVNGNASITGSLVASADITGSNLRAISSTTSPNISWSNTISSNGGEIRIVQTQFRGGNNITHVWSQTTDSNGTKDLGIRRNTTGSLEIYDGVTADGAIANRRDLLARNITGSNALISGSLTISGSANISGSISLNGSVLSAVSGFQQTFSAATTWTVTHNLNTSYPVITVYDSSNRVVLPASITATSANVVTITFNVATAGSVNILSGQLQQNMVLSNPSAVAIATVLGG